jgi:serine phosphatase RsbU (regulator of sigma subunit)
MVTATKGLFNNLAAAPDIPDTLRQISGALKAMNLRGLFMAMTMLKIKGGSFSISAAGMPSTLIYRGATGTVEEINLRALPLGSIASVKYQKQEFELEANDLIVLMSDGFPEMFNENGEMLGSEAAGEILRETANSSPQEIINRLVSAGENWAASRPADDDVTFVVIKRT